MKIFFYIPSLSGGGAERVISLISNELSNRGYHIYVYTTIENKVYQLGKRVNLIENPHRTNVISEIYFARKKIKKIKPDVIVGVMTDCFVFSYFARIGLNIPLIASDHTSYDRILPWHQNLIRKYFYRLATKTVVLTQRDLFLIEQKIKNAINIPNPVILPSTIRPLEEREKIILGVGRLDFWEVKGFDILISAWGAIAKEHPEWKLQIVGHGSQKNISYLMNLASSNNLSKKQFELLGFSSEITEIYQRAKIFVLSSRVEGFGLVLLEAMANGCICLTSDDHGRQLEIIGNKDLTFKGEKSLSDKLSSMIESKDLHNIQSQLIHQCRRFNIETIADKWSKLFKTVNSSQV